MLVGLSHLMLDEPFRFLAKGVQLLRQDVPVRINVRYEREMGSKRPIRPLWIEGYADFRGSSDYTEKRLWNGGGMRAENAGVWTCEQTPEGEVEYDRHGRALGPFEGPAIPGVAGVRAITDILVAGLDALNLHAWTSRFTFGDASKWRGRPVREIERWSVRGDAPLKVCSYYFEEQSGRLLGFEKIFAGQYLQRETVFIMSVRPLASVTRKDRTR